MKHYWWIVGLFFSLQGCENSTGSDPLPVEPPASERDYTRNVLLEDYTGIKCSNCPKAAEEAAVLKKSYGDRLVVVALHAGSFANPPLAEFDLRTPAGDVYNDYFKISGNPQGIVNRTLFEEAPFYPVSAWTKAVESVPMEASYSMKVAVDYQKESRQYTLRVEIARKEIATNSVDILLWLVEDKIVTIQTVEGGKWVDDYLQRHVFRGALNTPWGERIDWDKSESWKAIVEKTFQLPVSFKEGDCSVVVSIAHPDTKEILQVNECPLIARDRISVRERL